MDWVFQCNPKRYDLAALLEKGVGTERWSMNQHRNLVSPGDRIFLWETGPNARLLALGHTASPVYERDSPFGRYQVDIVLDHRVVPALTRAEVLQDKILANFGPFKGLMGTNFPIQSAEITVALDGLLGHRLVPIANGEMPEAGAVNVQSSLDTAIKKARQHVAASLSEHIAQMDPIAFEWLVRALLLKLGYTDVTVTKPSGDGGVDLRATLVGGGVAQIRTCIQVKRQQTVGAPVVQSIRGSLSAHEAGLLVTSGHFTAGARAEAIDPHKLPITLVSGGELVELLLRHQIGVEAVSLTYRPKFDDISKERLEAVVEEQSAPG